MTDVRCTVVKWIILWFKTLVVIPEFEQTIPFKQGSHVHKPPHQQHILKMFANSFGRLVKKSLALHTKENSYMCDGCSSPCVG